MMVGLLYCFVVSFRKKVDLYQNVIIICMKRVVRVNVVEGEVQKEMIEIRIVKFVVLQDYWNMDIKFVC